MPCTVGLLVGLVVVSSYPPQGVRRGSGAAAAAATPTGGLSGEPWRLAGAQATRPLHELVIPLGRSAVSVPILEYHYIRTYANRSDRMGFLLSVTPSDFAAQMGWLAAHGYHPVTIHDLRAYFYGLRPLPARPVILTFDDGYADFFTTAEPILRAFGFRSVAYIVPGFWGRKQYMSAQQVLDLDRSGLVEIASHTVDHVNLARAPAGWRWYQLVRSRQMLEQVVGHAVLDFCYPSGEFGDGAWRAAGAVYSTGTTELPGTELAWSDRLTWPRVRVAGGEALKAFVAGLGSPEPVVMETFTAAAAPPA